MSLTLIVVIAVAAWMTMMLFVFTMLRSSSRADARMVEDLHRHMAMPSAAEPELLLAELPLEPETAPSASRVPGTERPRWTIVTDSNRAARRERESERTQP